MLDIAKLKLGDKVHYQPEHYKKDDKWENRIIKRIRDNNMEAVFVVYNCGGNCADYTAALTNLRDLKLGWKH